MKIFFTFILTLTLASCMGVFGEYETPKYKVLSKQENIELREYYPNLVAEVEVFGERNEAANEAFKKLAGFIFGDNIVKSKISMTAPVVQEKTIDSSQKIAMTTPVVQEKSGDSWKVRFIMPSEYTLETLPKPINNEIKIYEDKTKKYVVIRFSGFWSDKKLNKKASLLNDYVKQKNLTKLSEVIYNFYNPPFTLPFLRRNEIMYEVK
jgi:hypothetical protein